jgi:hypothetical protein
MGGWEGGVKTLIDMTGDIFGRLTVKNRTRKTDKSEWYWLCICICGALIEVKRSNLLTGSVRSCGCLSAELTAERNRARKKIISICTVDGCGEEARECGRTLCRKHGKRMRLYGNTNFVTSEESRAKRQRASILKRFDKIKPTTYRKLHGRHEHRVIGEKIAGRSLRTDEHVHHIDHDKHNNKPENLIVLSKQEHARLHAMENRRAKS